MNKILISSMALLLLSACTKEEPNFDPADYDCNSVITNTHPKEAEFQAFINQKRAEGLPGISMLIETPAGIWTGTAGFAELLFKTPMQTCSLHKIGSSSKVFTATLIFQLYQQGLLDFDDLITQHLPLELIDRVANYETVSIKNLLNHTSGIPDYLDINLTLNYYDDLNRIWTDQEELQMIYDIAAEFPVGEYQNYSNTNYLLLGMIAKQITAKNATELYEEKIFEPLELWNSHFSEKGDLPPNLVRGYHDENGKGNFIDITERSYARHSMAGGISSTVEDLHRLLKATWQSNTLLSDSTKALITTLENTAFLHPEKFEYGAANKVKRIKGIGLCWFQYDTEYGVCYGHDGGFDGRRSVMRYFPDSNTSIVYLVNGSGESIRKILREMKRNDVLELVFE